MPLTTAETLRAWILSALVVHGVVGGNPDAKRLYDDLLSNYNKLVRPVVNTSDVLKVSIKLKLSQLIDVVSIRCGFDSLLFSVASTNLQMHAFWSFCWFVYPLFLRLNDIPQIITFNFPSAFSPFVHLMEKNWKISRIFKLLNHPRWQWSSLIISDKKIREKFKQFYNGIPEWMKLVCTWEIWLYHY